MFPICKIGVNNRRINTIMVVEIYSYNSGIRIIDKFEYENQHALDKDLVVRRLSGTWVGHKIYDISMAEFNRLTPTQRNNLDCKAVFDKEAYIGAGK